MKLLTINMAMELDKLIDRIQALGRLIQSKKPEFVVLQGMSTEGLKVLRSLPWAGNYNINSPPTTFDNRKKPCCVIMSLYPSEDMKWFNYRNPDTHRYVVWCYYVMNDKHKRRHVLTIATTQLEVGIETEASITREKQMNQALFCVHGEDCIVLGDFSIIDIVDGDIQYNGGWQDAWLSLNHSPEAGNTFVPSSNTLIKAKDAPSFRPDMVIYKTRRYKLDSMEVVGTEVDEGLKTHISKQFGLLATFQLLDNASFLPLVPPPDVPCTFNRQ